MKKGKRIIAVFLYLLTVALLMGLRLRELFDIRQFLLVLAGGVFLYLPSMEKEDFRHLSRPDFALLARDTIYASYIETFVLLFLFLYHGPEAGQTEMLAGMQESGRMADTVPGILMRNIALGFRPLLYGICIWIALGSEERKDGSKSLGREGTAQAVGELAGEEKRGSDAAKEPDTDKESDCLLSGAKGADDSLDKMARGSGGGSSGKDRGSGRGDSPSGKNGNMWAMQEYYQYFMETGLTRRETEVALQICKGISNKEIAMELGISETTVKKHVSNIFEKLGINRREEIYRLLAGDICAK